MELRNFLSFPQPSLARPSSCTVRTYAPNPGSQRDCAAANRPPTAQRDWLPLSVVIAANHSTAAPPFDPLLPRQGTAQRQAVYRLRNQAVALETAE